MRSLSMNRLEEYMGLIDVPSQRKMQEPGTSFYDEINNRIEALGRRITKALSYKELLVREEEFAALASGAQETLHHIAVEGSNDLVLHFDGVKKIIQMKLQEMERRLSKSKESKMGLQIELEPEKPQTFRDVGEAALLQEENRRLVEEHTLEGYRLTRRRLLEVEVLQETIFQHLTLQDERIDDVVDLTSRAGKIIHSTADTLNSGRDSGRFVRRLLFIMLLCLSFTLLFLHYYYR
jgi:syntaxin 18